MQRTKIEKIILIFLVISSSLLSWARLRNGHHWGDDFASYVMQAQSILEHNPGGFIEENRLTVEQSTRLIGPLAAPWGVPLMLTPLVALVGFDILYLKSLNLVCYPLFLIALWFGFRNKLSKFNLTLLVALFAFNPEMVGANNNIGSDIPFLLFATACLFWIEHTHISKKVYLSPFADQALLGLLIAIAFFIRANGILLFFTVIAIEIIQYLKFAWNNPVNRGALLRQIIRQELKLPSLLIKLTPYFTFMIMVLVWTRIFPEGNSGAISGFTASSLETIFDQVKYYFLLPIEFFQKLPFANLIYFATLPLLITGMISRIKQDYHIYFYLFLTVSLFIIWPGRQGLRYIFPILPFYVYFWISGLQIWVDYLKKRKFKLVEPFARTGLVLLTLGFASICVYDATRNLLRNRLTDSGPYTTSAQDMFSYISDHTEPQAIIVFFKPRALRMLTGRPSIQIEFPSKIDRGDYLCLYLGPDAYQQISAQQADELVKSSQLSLVYANGEYRLYRILKPPSPAAEAFYKRAVLTARLFYNQR